MAPEVSRLLKEVDGSKLPSDLVSDLNRRIYYALVEFDFSLLTDEASIQFFENLGCGTTEAWHYVGRSKSASGRGFRSIIDLAIKILGRDRCTAALIVGYLLGLRPEYCFSTFPLKEESNLNITIRNSQIQERIPNQLEVGRQCYVLGGMDYLHDFCGIREQAVCFYEDKACRQNSFFLIASVIEMNGIPTLRIGAAPASARLFSRTEMAWYQDAVVFICSDNHVAKDLRHIAYGSRHFEWENFIISGCFGGADALKFLDLKSLSGHGVVYVPEFNREALVSATKFVERCEKAGATSVSIYPWPIIAGEDLDCVSDQDKWRDVLLEQAVRLEDVELPSKLVHKIREKAIPRSEYAKWLISVGLVASANIQTDNDLADDDDMQFICLGDILDEDTEVSEPVTLESIFNHEDCTVMWAPTDAGKSWGALKFGIGLATGTEAFGIPARCFHVVGIMDGEISIKKKRKHVRQLLQDRPELITLAEQNLVIMPPAGKLKRFNEEYADRLIPKLKKLNIEVLILDNLQALDPKAGKFNAEDLFAFVRRMKLEGIAIFIIHHADKEGKNYKGPTDLVDLSQTVFRGEGGDEVRKLVLDDPDKTHVLEACDEGGPVLRLTITKCKVGGMKGKSVIYHLPIRGVWTHLEGDLVPTIDPDPLPASVNAESEDNSAIPVLEKIPEMHSLTPDEEKVYASLKGKKYTRSELEAVTGFKADKLGKILRRLVVLNFVETGGVGRSSYYRGL
jgi:hypothetical protein